MNAFLTASWSYLNIVLSYELSCIKSNEAFLHDLTMKGVDDLMSSRSTRRREIGTDRSWSCDILPSTTHFTHFRRLPASLQLRRRTLLATWHQTAEENQSQSDDPLRQGSTDAPEIASPCGSHQSGLSGCWMVMISDGVCLPVFVVCEWRVVWCMCRVASRRVVWWVMCVVYHGWCVVCRASWPVDLASWMLTSCFVSCHEAGHGVLSWVKSCHITSGHVKSWKVKLMSSHVKSRHTVSYHIVTCLHHVTAHRGGPRGPELAKCPVLETSVEQCQRLQRQLAGCRPTSNTGWVEHAWIVLHVPRHDAQCGCPTQWMRLWRPCRPRSRQHTWSDHGVHGRVRPWVSRQSRRNVTGRYCRGWYLLRGAACFAKKNSLTQRASAETSARQRNNTNWPWTRQSKARSRGSCRGHGGSIRGVAPATRGIPNVRQWRWRWRRCHFIRNARRCRRRCFETWDHVDTKSELLSAWQYCLSRPAWQCCLSQLGKWMYKPNLAKCSSQADVYETHLTNTSSRSSTQSVYLWNCALRFKFFEVTWVHTRCKMNNSAFFCSRSMTFFLRWTFFPDYAVMICHFPTLRQLRFLRPESSSLAWRILIGLCARL